MRALDRGAYVSRSESLSGTQCRSNFSNLHGPVRGVKLRQAHWLAAAIRGFVLPVPATRRKLHGLIRGVSRGGRFWHRPRSEALLARFRPCGGSAGRGCLPRQRGAELRRHRLEERRQAQHARERERCRLLVVERDELPTMHRFQPVVSGQSGEGGALPPLPR
jgi:hypothetical protein